MNRKVILVGYTVILTIALIAAYDTFAQGEPFGISMGDNPEKYDCTSSGDAGYVYDCADVPKSHPDVDQYVVWSLEETGIALIKAIGEIHENDKYGNSIRAEIDAIAEQIASVYGEWSNHIDYIRSSGIWNESDEWTMSIRQGERYYGYVWELGEGEVTEIQIQARALSSDAAAFVLDFQLSNYERFEEIRKNRGASAF